jgi:hypothetical protein
MLLRLFKGTGPGVILLIIITLVSVWISAFINPQIDTPLYSELDPMPLFGLLQQVIGNNKILGVVFSFSMVSIMAFLLVNFNTTIFFINERTYLPAVIYILFGGLFPQYQLLNPVMPAAVFLMLAIIRIIDGYRKQGTAYNFFDAGILISTGSLFYANLIWFGLLVIIGIALLRTVNIQEIAISILGLITPYLIAFGVYYVIEDNLGDLFNLIKNNFSAISEDYIYTRLTVITMIFSGLGILVSIVYLMIVISTKKIKSRKTFYLLIWGFIISLGIYFSLPSVSVEIVWLISIPISYFLAHYIVFSKKKLLPEIFFTLLFILIMLIQILYLK